MQQHDDPAASRPDLGQGQRLTLTLSLSPAWGEGEVRELPSDRIPAARPTRGHPYLEAGGDVPSHDAMRGDAAERSAYSAAFTSGARAVSQECSTGSTSLANSRIDFSAISYGMPPKRNE